MITKAYLVERLQNGTGEVYFTKVDGTDREMVCTLNPDNIPDTEHSGFERSSASDEVVRVWDLQAKGWRSFRVDSIYEMWVDGDLIIPEPIIEST